MNLKEVNQNFNLKIRIKPKESPISLGETVNKSEKKIPGYLEYIYPRRPD